MSLKKCPNCGNEVLASAPACPECGKDLAPAWLKLGCALAVILIIGAAIVGRLIVSGSTPRRSRRVMTAGEKAATQLKDKLKYAPVNQLITERIVTATLGSDSKLSEAEQKKYLEKITGEKIRWTGKFREVMTFEHGDVIRLEKERNKMGLNAVVFEEDSDRLANLKEGEEVTVLGIVAATAHGALSLMPAELER